MKRCLNDVDVEEELLELEVHPNETAASYRTYQSKFCSFCNCLEDDCKRYLNDRTICAFMLALGDEFGWKPHTKKSSMAAIGSLLKKYELKNIYKHEEEYPKTHRVLAVIFILCAVVV